MADTKRPVAAIAGDGNDDDDDDDTYDEPAVLSIMNIYLRY